MCVLRHTLFHNSLPFPCFILTSFPSSFIVTLCSPFTLPFHLVHFLVQFLYLLYVLLSVTVLHSIFLPLIHQHFLPFFHSLFSFLPPYCFVLIHFLYSLYFLVSQTFIHSFFLLSQCTSCPSTSSFIILYPPFVFFLSLLLFRSHSLPLFTILSHITKLALSHSLPLSLALHHTVCIPSLTIPVLHAPSFPLPKSTERNGVQKATLKREIQLGAPFRRQGSFLHVAQLSMQPTHTQQERARVYNQAPWSSF